MCFMKFILTHCQQTLAGCGRMNPRDGGIKIVWGETGMKQETGKKKMLKTATRAAFMLGFLG